MEVGYQMGKILVQYYSETGHTQVMAELVAAGAAQIPGIEVRLRTVAESTLEDVIWCDGLASGVPHPPGIDPVAGKEVVDVAAGEVWGKIDGKFACAFSLGGRAGRRCRINLHGFNDHSHELWFSGFRCDRLCCTSAYLALWCHSARLSQNPGRKRPLHPPGHPAGRMGGLFVDGEESCHPKFASYPRHG